LWSRETAARNQDMAVGVKSQKIFKGLDGCDDPCDGFFYRWRYLDIDFFMLQENNLCSMEDI